MSRLISGGEIDNGCPHCGTRFIFSEKFEVCPVCHKILDDKDYFYDKTLKRFVEDSDAN